MAQPVWYTKPGSLGTIEEGKFFQISLIAEDPELSEVYFTLLSGKLPAGIQVTNNGVITGIPKPYANVQGVPAEVGENVTSKFSIRAFTKDGDVVDRLNDRTFEITVTGQDIPEFITPSGNIGTFLDGDSVNYQIQFVDSDISDNAVAYVAAGELPPGLSMDTNGLIRGNIEPVDVLGEGGVAGWDGSAGANTARWDEFPWDFSSQSISKNYQFTVKITDGKEYRLRTFEIYVYSRDSLTADATEYTADNMYLRTDLVTSRTPYMTNYPPSGELTAYRHDNFYIYQFQGADPDDDQVEYNVVSESISGFDNVYGFDVQPFSYEFNYNKYTEGLPPGLQVDQTTGYMYGYIPNIGLQDIVYSFVVRVSKVINSDIYQDFRYTINIFGNVDVDVTWVTPQNLGTIDNGTVSLLSVQATHLQGIPLQYRLKQGSDNLLPRGLQLLPSGNIAGRVSYQVFSLDQGATTFDSKIRTRLDIDETTWDREYTFTVQAYNTDEIVNVDRTFTITVNQEYSRPSQSLRIEAFAPQEDRDLVGNLVDNSDIFKNEWIYRADDPWFGICKNVRYDHAHGLEPASFKEYTNSVIKNHFRKKIVLGELRTARALDENDNIIYEVVYANVVDTQVNNDGESPASEVELKYPVTLADGSTQIETVYPNSLTNMRDRVVSEIGQVAPMLPRWMLSKQEDGTVLGFTRAWVVCYTQPGRSKQIKYNIDQEFGTQLGRVDFIADRYVIDKYSSHNWDTSTDSWIPSAQTTFDRADVNTSGETTFDSNSMRFLTNIDKCEYTDAYDKYILFPQRRIIDNGE